MSVRLSLVIQLSLLLASLLSEQGLSFDWGSLERIFFPGSNKPSLEWSQSVILGYRDGPTRSEFMQAMNLEGWDS